MAVRKCKLKLICRLNVSEADFELELILDPRLWEYDHFPDKAHIYRVNAYFATILCHRILDSFWYRKKGLKALEPILYRQYRQKGGVQ